MIKVIKEKTYYSKGRLYSQEEVNALGVAVQEANKKTMAYSILSAHNVSGSDDKLKLKFDALASHDITYVGIIQTAKASGLETFPIPYVLTNCHNSLCAVGGTINEDDHLFGLSAAKKYGGIFVPPHLAVIHTYMREMMSGVGKMILGSDSHTRYGALGTMAIGEGGPELVKQLLSRTYDIAYPEVVAVVLKNKLRKGVGPQDVALTLIGEVFKSGFVKNKVLEFVGDGIENLSMEERNGIDVMTTETACLSSIWRTDVKTKEYFVARGRIDAYSELNPGDFACYDGAVEIDLSKVEPMIALPFHPSNTYTLKTLIENPYDIFAKCEKDAKELRGKNAPALDLMSSIDKNGQIRVNQGVIAGCAGGTYDNIVKAGNILDGRNIGSGDFTLSVYPSSQPVYADLVRNGTILKLMQAGAIVKTAFCGPCFGAGDVPANGTLSIRHTTRNFESREGSKPADGQSAGVALMDSMSIAATAANGGVLTQATDIDFNDNVDEFVFDSSIYKNRVYNGYKAPEKGDLRYGPNIADWPKIEELKSNLLVKLAAAIYDEVTTTDELIPSGETSSYRSNPLKLAEFALSRKVPEYVGRAKAIKSESLESEEMKAVLSKVGATSSDVSYGSAVYATKPGDGSAREQAASCQRVLGGAANFAVEYATKRYRSNLINWGMMPFLTDEKLEVGDYVYVKDVLSGLRDGKTEFNAVIIRENEKKNIVLKTGELTPAERKIIECGCLMNYYNKGN